MIYSSIISSKTELSVPLFSDAKPFHSKYDPEREASQFVSTIEKKDFFLIGGLGAGYQIKALKEKFPDSFILVLENSKEDLDFLFTNCKELLQLTDIHFTTIENIEKDLIEHYIPAIYTTFSFIDIKSWSYHVDMDNITTKINATLKKIGSDFSVQAHFGKIWQKNILLNLKLVNEEAVSVPADKTACIIAAGPTLDSKLQYLKDNRNDLYIIATDTAFKSLLRSKIKPDAVVSIDGQFISSMHFSARLPDDVLYIFELTGNNSAALKIKKSGAKLLFSVSEHPFEKLVQNFSCNSFLNLDSTSGTVTVTAIDFAKKAGFKKIKVLGADFGFYKNKPYTKGTYLDDIYLESQNRITSDEKKYSHLMYRTETIRKPSKITTETLSQYEKNFLDWCSSSNLKVTLKNNEYFIDNNTIGKFFKISLFNYKEFYAYINSQEAKESMNIALLPLIAFFKNKDGSAAKNNTFSYYLKLATEFISRYKF